MDFQKITALLIAFTAIISGLLGLVLSFDFAFGTSEKEAGEGNNNGGNCDPSYPDDCIPSPPLDLDCGDNGVPNNVKVLQPNPHRLDGDRDGVGCKGSGNTGGVDSSDTMVITIEVLPLQMSAKEKLIASEEQ